MNTPGAYAVTNTPVSWFDKPARKTVTTKKSKSTARVINPIFEEATAYVTDPFWIDILRKASLGKLPRGYRFQNRVLTHKIGTRQSMITISTIPREVAIECINFFRTESCMISPQEKQDQIDEAKAQSEEEEYKVPEKNEWKDLKKSNKSYLIYLYCKTLKQKYELSTGEFYQLKAIVEWGLGWGYFQSNHIEFDGKDVVNIRGLHFDTNRRVFYIDDKLKPKTSKSSNKDEAVKISKKEVSLERDWRKNITELYKRSYETIPKSVKKPKINIVT